jgi:putative ABC transport system substrate-binding protein
MKYKIIISIVFASIFLVYYQYKKLDKKKYTIAIMQTASHPSLDAAREGFILELKNNFKNDEIDFLLFNVEGSVSNAHSVASQLFYNKDIIGFYAIGSLTAQAIHNLEKIRPIFISAVSDPKSLGFIYENSNVIGLSDMVSPEIPCNLIKSIIPEAKNIGLLYSQSNLNQNECINIKKILEENNKNVFNIVVNSEGDIISALNNHILKIDLILSPCDNIVAIAIPIIAQYSLLHKKPFVSCFNEAIGGGAFASCGINYYKSGQDVGKIAVLILKKEKKISDFNIGVSINNDFYINKIIAEKLNIDITNIDNNIIIL